MFKLLQAVHMPVALIVLFSIGLFVPGLSMLVLILAVGRATRALQKAGVRVGLLGANLATLL
jgi:sugar phosphate permease